MGEARRWAEGTVHGWTVYEGESNEDCNDLGSGMDEIAARELVRHPAFARAIDQIRSACMEFQANEPAGDLIDQILGLIEATHG